MCACVCDLMCWILSVFYKSLQQIEETHVNYCVQSCKKDPCVEVPMVFKISYGDRLLILLIYCISIVSLREESKQNLIKKTLDINH